MTASKDLVVPSLTNILPIFDRNNIDKSNTHLDPRVQELVLYTQVTRILVLESTGKHKFLDAVYFMYDTPMLNSKLTNSPQRTHPICPQNVQWNINHRMKRI